MPRKPKKMRPVTDSLDTLEDLGGLIKKARGFLVPIRSSVEGMFLGYETAIESLTDVLSDNTGLDRIGRLKRANVSRALHAQAEHLQHLYERTIRHVAHHMDVIGGNLWNRKVRKKSKLRIAANSAGSNDGPIIVPFKKNKGLPPSVEDSKPGKSKAETLSIEALLDLIQQCLETSPDTYHSVWVRFGSTVAEWWVSTLRRATAEVRGFAVVIPAQATYNAVTASSEDIEKIRQKGFSAAVRLPPSVLVQAEANTATAFEIVSQAVAVDLPLRSIKKEARKYHSGSASKISAKVISSLVQAAVGRMIGSLSEGILPFESTASVELSPKARIKSLPEGHTVIRKIVDPDRRFRIQFRMRNETVTEASASVFLEAEVRLLRKTRQDLASALLKDVDLDRKDPSASFSLIEAKLAASDSDKYRISIETEPDRGLVFIRAESDIPVNRLSTTSSSKAETLRQRSVASVQSVIGTPESNVDVAKTAEAKSNGVIRYVDAYDKSTDVSNALTYSVTLAFSVDAEAIESSDGLRDAVKGLQYVCRMFGTSVQAHQTASDQRMIRDFIERHGTAQKRVQRVLRGRVLLNHPDRAGTYESFKKKRDGHEIRNVNGRREVAREADGWSVVHT